MGAGSTRTYIPVFEGVGGATPQFTYFLRCLDECLDFGCRVVRGDAAGFVAQEEFAILKTDPAGA